MYSIANYVLCVSVVLLLGYVTLELFYGKVQWINRNFHHVYSHKEVLEETGEKLEPQFNSSHAPNTKANDSNNIHSLPKYAKDTINDWVDSVNVKNNIKLLVPIYLKDTSSFPKYTTKDTINYNVNAKDAIIDPTTKNNSPNDPIHEEKLIKLLGIITIVQLVSEHNDYKYVNFAIAHIKSVMLFTDKPVRYLLFGYDRAPQMVVDQISSWPEEIRKRLSIQTIVISLDDIPSMGYGITEGDINLVKRVPHIKTHYLIQVMLALTHLKYAILMDCDTLVISDITDTWKLFLNFNELQFAAMGPGGRAYIPKNKFSYIYGENGLNSGVFLLDLEKCSGSGLAEDMIQTLKKGLCYNSDQCLLMRYFMRNPQTLHYLTCSYNLFNGMNPCKYPFVRPYCKAVYTDGIYIYHGTMYLDLQPFTPYGILYKLIREYKFYNHSTGYWEEGLRKFTKAKEKCGDASAKTLKHNMQKAMLLN